MTSRKKRTTAGDKTICLPLSVELDYDTFVKNTAGYRWYLDQMIALYRELFPVGIEQGYRFHGFVSSGKLHLSTRRIRLNVNGEVYQIRPDTVMPYMVGKNEEVEKGLYLRQHGVPYDGIAHVLGHNGMYWYHATQSLSRISIVGSTVKTSGVFTPQASGR